MPCFHPMAGFRAQRKNASGKRSIVFNANQGYVDQPVTVPCGQCIGCRLERSRQWAVRLMHEASLHKENSFLTLTYSPENLPNDGSLNREHFQLFMKRLRKKYAHKKIKYFHCGEYGEKLGRPHYHACVFGLDFNDKQHHFTNDNGDKIYTSQKLSDIWGLGQCMIGDVTFESAAYVARYVTKKITGALALDHYNDINYETGEILSERKPEYQTGSNGLGRGWFEKYTSDIYPNDFILVRGKKCRVPKYYDSKYEVLYPDDHAKIKALRTKAARDHQSNNTRDRLDVREESQLIKNDLLHRNFEK